MPDSVSTRMYGMVLMCIACTRSTRTSRTGRFSGAFTSSRRAAGRGCRLLQGPACPTREKKMLPTSYLGPCNLPPQKKQRFHHRPHEQLHLSFYLALHPHTCAHLHLASVKKKKKKGKRKKKEISVHPHTLTHTHVLNPLVNRCKGSAYRQRYK